MTQTEEKLQTLAKIFLLYQDHMWYVHEDFLKSACQIWRAFESD